MGEGFIRVSADMLTPKTATFWIGAMAIVVVVFQFLSFLYTGGREGGYNTAGRLRLTCIGVWQG